MVQRNAATWRYYEKLAPNRLIVTGASESYSSSLLALLGSLNLNWPGHPPVIVYDIGLGARTLDTLKRHGVAVRSVPQFCAHWRKYSTWKVWAWNDAPADKILWIDAGIAVLRPLADVFDIIDRESYFAVPNGMPLEMESSEIARRACGVPVESLIGHQSIAAGFIGFHKHGAVQALLEECLRLALVEENIKPTNPAHRMDQALISLLLHRDFHPVVTNDFSVYLMGDSPREVAGQAVWVHRRAIRFDDAAHLARHISAPGPPFLLRRTEAWRRALFPLRQFIRRAIKASGRLYEGVS